MDFVHFCYGLLFQLASNDIAPICTLQQGMYVGSVKYAGWITAFPNKWEEW